MKRFCIVSLYEDKATTSVILADGEMITIAEIERKAILRAWGARVNRAPFSYHDHLLAEMNPARRIKLSTERANTP